MKYTVRDRSLKVQTIAFEPPDHPFLQHVLLNNNHHGLAQVDLSLSLPIREREGNENLGWSKLRRVESTEYQKTSIPGVANPWQRGIADLIPMPCKF
jgi:hypothetical protein